MSDMFAEFNLNIIIFVFVVDDNDDVVVHNHTSRSSVVRGMPAEIFVNCCTTVGKIAFEKACKGESPWRSLKVIGNSAIR